MKNLAKKFLLPLGISLLSINPSFSQNSFFEKYLDKIPKHSVPEEFADYQSNKRDTLNDFVVYTEGFPDESMRLTWIDIDKDSLTDVLEISKIYLNDSGKILFQYPNPFGYCFYPGKQEESSEDYIDLNQDGLNGNEIQRKVFEIYINYYNRELDNVDYFYNPKKTINL
jgi:hypothetical protein